MRLVGLDEAQAGFKISGRNINNLRCADDPTHMAESKEELQSLLMKVKEESEIVDLNNSKEATDKELISKIYKQLLQLNSRKINDPVKKWAKEVTHISPKKTYRWLANI